MGDSARPKFTERVVSYISEEQKTKLELVLQDQEIKEAKLIRDLIDEHLKKFDAKGWPLTRQAV